MMNKLHTLTLLATMAGSLGGCYGADKTDNSSNAPGAAKPPGSNGVIHAIDTDVVPT